MCFPYHSSHKRPYHSPPPPPPPAAASYPPPLFLQAKSESAKNISSNHESVTIITLFLDSQMPKSEAIPQEMYKKKVFFFFLYTEIESSSVASKTRKKKIKNNSRTNLFKKKKKKKNNHKPRKASQSIYCLIHKISLFLYILHQDLILKTLQTVDLIELTHIRELLILFTNERQQIGHQTNGHKHLYLKKNGQQEKKKKNRIFERYRA